MVSRVPLLGMVLAMALLVGENLGANAYVAAKQREAEAVAQREDAIARVRAARLAAIAQHDALIRELERESAELKAKIDVASARARRDAAIHQMVGGTRCF